MPMREVRKKFTFSEIAIMSWRSKEMSANMHKNRSPKERSEETPVHEDSKPLPDYGLQHKPVRHPSVRIEETEDSYKLPSDINNGVAIPKKFFDDEGDLNLSKVTGAEAVRYCNAVGLKIPTVFK
jgi:hypothetical protein